MSVHTENFFRDLGRRRHEPWLHNANGSIRFDITDGNAIDRWLVTVDHGDTEVSHIDAEAEADCVIHTDRALFDALCTGEANGMAAMLRSALRFDGDATLLVLMQRMFPSPPGSRGPAPVTTGRRWLR